MEYKNVLHLTSCVFIIIFVSFALANEEKIFSCSLCKFQHVHGQIFSNLLVDSLTFGSHGKGSKREMRTDDSLM